MKVFIEKRGKMDEQINKLGQHVAEEVLETMLGIPKEVPTIDSFSDEIPSVDELIQPNRMSGNMFQLKVDNPQNQIMDDNKINPQILTKKNNDMNNDSGIIKNLDIYAIRECLDAMEVTSKVYKEDGVVVTTASKDENFDFDVVMLFSISGENHEWVKMLARATGQYFGKENLVKAMYNTNDYNRSRIVGTAYVNEDSDEPGKFYYVFENYLVGDKLLTKEYLEESVRVFCTSAWHFFSTFTK